MLSNEIKAKIFSLYLGQKVLHSTIYGVNGLYVTGSDLDKLRDDCYLLLRSVKQLTLEHAKQLFRIEHDYRSLSFRFELSSKGEVYGLYGRNDSIINCGLSFPKISHKGAIFLIGYGYAVDVTLLVDGDVRTIGVEEMCESGVIKMEM